MRGYAYYVVYVLNMLIYMIYGMLCQFMECDSRWNFNDGFVVEYVRVIFLWIDHEKFAFIHV